MKQQTLILVLAGTVAAASGLWLALQQQQADSTPTVVANSVSTLLPQPKPLSEFLLEDGQGRPFGVDQFKGAWDLVFFGFTHCPDICPTSLATMAKARSILNDAGVPSKDLPRLNFISVDPIRDKTADIANYAAYFKADIRAATGSKQELDNLSRQLGVVAYVPPDATEQGNYNVDHSAAIIIIDPQARYAGIYSAPHVATDIADDFKRFTQ